MTRNSPDRSGERGPDGTGIYPLPPMPAPIEVATPEEEQTIDVRRYFEGVRKRWWLVLLCVVLASAAAATWSLRQPNLFQARATVLVEMSTPNVLQGVQEVVPISQGGYWQSDEFYKKQHLVMRSRGVARLAAEKLGLPPPGNSKDAADAVRGRYAVVPDERTPGVIHIEVADTNPAVAHDMANAVAEAYIEANLERRIEGTRDAGGWLSLQHLDLKKKLERSEDALYEFMAANDVLNASLESQLDEVMQRLSAFNMKLAEVQAARISRQLNAKALQEARVNPELIDTLPEIRSVSTISKLKAKAVELRARRTELAGKYQAAHPKMLAIDEQLALISTELRGEIDATLLSEDRELASLENTELGLGKAIAQEREREARLNRLSLDFRRLQRDVKTNERLFEMVTSRMKETDLAGALRFNNVSLLEPAKEPRAPFSPDLKRDLMFGILLGLMFGLFLAVGLELLDNTLKTQDDVEEVVSVPFLGLVPLIELEGRGEKKQRDVVAMRDRDLYVLQNPKSSAAECCRFVRTNLMFMGTDRSIETLVVTSPNPQEGKTTTAINLAVTMAQAGSRTIIVDTDMRRPRLHRAFGMSNDLGVSSVLVGEVELDAAIQSSPQEGLDVLVCGPTPPNPAEVLHTRRFLELMEELKKRYDRIIFDSPPVGAVTDPVVLGNHTDGTILVLKCQKTTRDAAKQALRTLLDANVPVLGTILNDVDLDSRRYGRHYYQYYRKYGGYYGEDADAKQKVG